MCHFVYWVLFVCLSVAGALSSPLGFAETGKSTYRIALRVIPERVEPRRNQINTNNYIMLQIYFPLMSYNGSSLESAFLDMSNTKSLSSNFQDFQFCLKSGLQFTDGSSIRVSELLQAVRELHQVSESLPKPKYIRTKGNCVSVSLSQRDVRYFDKFLAVSSTILKSGTEQNAFPIGLGPYVVIEHTKDKIKMRAHQVSAPDNFKFIEISEWRQDSRVEEFDDINQIYTSKNFNFNSDHFKKIETPILKSYVLVVNLPDKNQRRHFAACMDPEELRTHLRPQLFPAHGFLPASSMGADVAYQYYRDKLGPCEDNFNRSTELYVLNSDEIEPMKKILHRIPSLRKNVLVKNIPIGELAKLVFSRKPMITMLGFDSSGSSSSSAPEASVFFESFVREERVITSPVNGLSRLISMAGMAAADAKKNELYRQAHELLLASGYVIPIGQVKSVQFYPKTISNIEWGDGFSGFPLIYKMRRND